MEIPKKPQNEYKIKINSSTDIYKLKEVQEIKDAVQEHILFVGLDNGNNVRNISLLGVGSENCVHIDTKFIIRTALVTASSKVVLVHNHPSNSVKPSEEDINLTGITKRLLRVFGIQLLDHLIVTEQEYCSLGKTGDLDKECNNYAINFMDKVLLIEENHRLKTELEALKNKENNLETGESGLEYE